MVELLRFGILVLLRLVPESDSTRAGGFFADGRIGFCTGSAIRGDETPLKEPEDRSKLFDIRGEGSAIIGGPGGAAKEALFDIRGGGATRRGNCGGRRFFCVSSDGEAEPDPSRNGSGQGDMECRDLADKHGDESESLSGVETTL